MQSPREELIEADILEYLTTNWVSCEKITTEWYYDAKCGFYRRRKSCYAKRWSADIQWSIPPYWRALYIEVKKPEEMKFFDRSVEEITLAMCKSSAQNKKRFIHAIEQREYLDEKIKSWAVAFFASSVEEVKVRLREQWVDIL